MNRNSGNFMIPLLVCLCALVYMHPSSAKAGPDLDEVLNYMYVDQGVPMVAFNCQFTPNRTIALLRNQPIGQVFATGMETENIPRIRVYIHVNGDWKPGEGAKLTVWDSPQKQTAFGSYTIWYEFRGYHFNVLEFEVNVPVSPGHVYYMELSYVDDGRGDGVLSPVGVMNGQFYYDIWQRVIHVDQSVPQSGDGSTWAKSFKTISEALAAIGNRPVAQGYLNGQIADFDLCFQSHGKKRLDRTGNLKKMFDRFNLDRPGLEEIRSLVRKQDYETAVSKMVAYFEAREHPVRIIDPATVPNPNPDYDLTAAEYAMQNIFWGDTGYGFVGPDINWRPTIDFNANGDPIASSFTMNRYGPRGTLANAYLNTGDHKYAGKLNDMLLDWYRDNPPPEKSKIGGVPFDDVWASLNTGIRISHSFIAYNRVHSSPAFTTDCRMAYNLNLADHCDTLVWNGAGAGGNWAITQNTALMTHALNFEEYKRSQLWFDTAESRIDEVLIRDFLPDGIENESSPGYQRWMCYNPLVDVHKLLLERNKQTAFSSKLKSMLEVFAEYFMYLYMPNLASPEFGDWGDAAAGFLISDAELYNRPDMLYVGTSGAQGIKPASLSKLWPSAGVVTLRSDWGDMGRPFEDARYLFFHGVHYGSHGHSDLNGITAYAYGRELLTDPGSYIYGSLEHDLLTKSESHNLLTVNGENQPWPMPDTPFENWGFSSIADYVSFNRPNAYSTGDYRREVWFIRTDDSPANDYWVIRDTAAGSGTHSLEQRWHFNPTTVTIDGSLTTKTGHAEGGNLAVMQVTPSRLTTEQRTTNTWRPRGNQEPPLQLPNVIYKATTALPASIDTLLFPYDGPQMPQAQMQTLETGSNGRESVFKMTQGTVADLFALRQAAGSKTIASENVSFNGERLFIRRVNGAPKSAVLIRGSQLTVDGQQVVNLPSPAPYVTVTFGPSGASVQMETDSVSESK